ncbi:hypothetical protein M3568_19605 [Priestia flexa]|uniref:hypothetical protein n=1 Tax=Priestia flexa TaxID=86664 RepID=UPI0020405510|nr:hypothetical protein [Priestia flexa]MCM3068523.1 hypothetical protein [Priestia flexa]
MLEEFSDVEHLCAAISRWTSQLTVADIQATSSFLMDLNTRKSRINTMMVLAYNQHNNPEPEDICFFIPGKQNDWVLARNEDNRFNLELTSKALILRQENRHRFLPRFRLVAFKKSLNL